MRVLPSPPNATHVPEATPAVTDAVAVGFFALVEALATPATGTTVDAIW